MKNGAGRIGVLGLVLLGLVPAVGCPESNVLEPGVGETAIRVEVVNVNPAGRFVDDMVGLFIPPFTFIPPDSASIQIRSIIVEPVGAAAQDADGGIAINLLLDVANPGYTDQTQVDSLANLPTGSYRVLSVTFASFFLEDNSDGMGGNRVDPADWDDPMAPTCGDFIRSFQRSLRTQQLTLTDFGREVIFQVDGDGGGSLTLRVDGEALIDTLEDNIRCGICTCEENYDPMNPSTLDCKCDPSNPSNGYVVGVAEFGAAGPIILSFE